MSSFELVFDSLRLNNQLYNTHNVGTDNVSIRGDAGITKSTNKPKVLDTRALPIAIPIEVLNDRNFSALEAIVRYLKEEHNLTYSQIAVMLQRDDRTIWTTYQRAIKKANTSEVPS